MSGGASILDTAIPIINRRRDGFCTTMKMQANDYEKNLNEFVEVLAKQLAAFKTDMLQAVKVFEAQQCEEAKRRAQESVIDLKVASAMQNDEKIESILANISKGNSAPPKIHFRRDSRLPDTLRKSLAAMLSVNFVCPRDAPNNFILVEMSLRDSAVQTDAALNFASKPAPTVRAPMPQPLVVKAPEMTSETQTDFDQLALLKWIGTPGGDDDDEMFWGDDEDFERGAANGAPAHLTNGFDEHHFHHEPARADDFVLPEPPRIQTSNTFGEAAAAALMESQRSRSSSSGGDQFAMPEEVYSLEELEEKLAKCRERVNLCHHQWVNANKAKTKKKFEKQLDDAKKDLAELSAKHAAAAKSANTLHSTASQTELVKMKGRAMQTDTCKTGTANKQVQVDEVTKKQIEFTKKIELLEKMHDKDAEASKQKDRKITELVKEKESLERKVPADRKDLVVKAKSVQTEIKPNCQSKEVQVNLMESTGSGSVVTNITDDHGAIVKMEYTGESLNNVLRSPIDSLKNLRPGNGWVKGLKFSAPDQSGVVACILQLKNGQTIDTITKEAKANATPTPKASAAAAILVEIFSREELRTRLPMVVAAKETSGEVVITANAKPKPVPEPEEKPEQKPVVVPEPVVAAVPKPEPVQAPAPAPAAAPQPKAAAETAKPAKAPAKAAPPAKAPAKAVAAPVVAPPVEPVDTKKMTERANFMKRKFPGKFGIDPKTVDEEEERWKKHKAQHLTKRFHGYTLDCGCINDVCESCVDEHVLIHQLYDNFYDETDID